jgi:hypothetical protein
MEQLNKEYHYYAEGVGNDYGFWTQINTKGEIIDGSNSETTDQPKSNLEDLNNNTLDKEYWFNYIIENSGEYWIVSKLPDSLFIDKPFVLSILERFPNLYSNFRVQYSDDSDISELAFNFSFRNFDFFSERIKVLYQERYDKMLNEEGKKLFDTNITLAGLDDDLPF